jgi:hypothetical protein
MQEADYLFAFFPYLKTSEPVRYRNVVIRSSDDYASLPPKAIRHLDRLTTMFFLRDHLRIQKMSYAFHTQNKDFDAASFKRELVEFQALIRFVYSAPPPQLGDPFLRYEHGSLYLMMPRQIPRAFLTNDHNVEMIAELENSEFDSRDRIDGYEGQLDSRASFVVRRCSRILPPVTGIWLNIAQDLGIDLNHRFSHSQLYSTIMDYFQETTQEEELRKRVLTALLWYNRSTSIGTDESVALVNLAIAFESLLGLEAGSELTKRFKEAVSLIVGPVSRLDSWLHQFYATRSQIVHEGQSQSLKFIATDDPKKPREAVKQEYRSLVSYGWQMFRACATGILAGAQAAREMRLASVLVTNQQRLERICQQLTKKEGTPSGRMLATRQDVNDVAAYRFVQEDGLTVNQLIGTAKLMVQQYLDCSPEEPPGQLVRMREFSTVDSNDYQIALSLLRDIHEGFGSQDALLTPSETTLRSIVSSLVDSVWGYTFIFYFHLENHQRKRESGKD